MHADYALPKNYVIFGKVTKGIEVVDKIATAPVTTSASGEQSQPVNPVKSALNYNRGKINQPVSLIFGNTDCISPWFRIINNQCF